jgi:DNA-3-methyladenine glycosylase
LLGRLIVRDDAAGRRVGRIVEVEAYGGARDPASHASRGPTPRNRTMFGPPGHAYIYVSYGVHHCLNVVTGVGGQPSAVLIRALEPLEGLALMEGARLKSGVRAGRSTKGRAGGRAGEHSGSAHRLHLARGPGLVARALGLTLEHDGADLTGGTLWLAGSPQRGARIARSPRIGISHAVSRRWRFFLAGHPSVSGPRRRRASRRAAQRGGARR